MRRAPSSSNYLADEEMSEKKKSKPAETTYRKSTFPKKPRSQSHETSYLNTALSSTWDAINIFGIFCVLVTESAGYQLARLQEKLTGTLAGQRRFFGTEENASDDDDYDIVPKEEKTDSCRWPGVTH